MASIIKNQIIKHLSAFARDLKPEQISMAVLRGKAQLENLTLNEEVLTEKLELPPWLKIVSARCNRVSVDIPWRKLKTSPVQLFVDELRVVVRLVASTASSQSSHQKTAPIPSSQQDTAKSYSLADRVVETMSLFVQSIEIFFESDRSAELGFGGVGFNGSITLYNLALRSAQPTTWKEEEVNVNSTRIHDKTIRQVLFFKQLSWRLLKFEASAHQKNYDHQRDASRSKTNSPLRLLTMEGKCRISIKKSSHDCSLVAGKIELMLDEIHWLTTLYHLRMAIDFYKHLLELANIQSQADTALLLGPQHNPFTDSRPRQKPVAVPPPVSNLAPYAPPSAASFTSSVPCVSFRQFEFPQSSHHLSIAKVDLLLIDDSASDSLPPDWNLEKGAMQASIHRIRLDFYPRHRIFDANGVLAPRHHWVRYQSPNSFTDLTKQLLDQHYSLLHAKLDLNKRERFVRIWPQLTSQNVILRIDNIILQQVTEQNTKKDSLREMFGMDKRDRDRLPHSMSFFHLEITHYFFPASNAFSVPSDSVHLVMAPLDLTPDPKSVRWLVYAIESIANAIEVSQQQCAKTQNQNDQITQVQVRIELFMPKVVLIPSSTSSFSDPTTQSAIDHRLPRRFIVRTSTVLFSNFVLFDDPLVPFPVMFKNRMGEKQLQFVDWAEGRSIDAKVAEELRRKTHFNENVEFLMNEQSKRNEWFLSIPSLWINCDFGPNSWELPLMTDLNIFGTILLDSTDPTRPGNCILVEPRTDVGAVVDHFQFVQLTQLLNDVSTMLAFIDQDRAFFHKQMQNVPMDVPVALYCQCEKIHLRLILPTGPTPSPYDPKWSTGTSEVVSPSNTSMSCSDLPADETASNSAQLFSTRSRKETTTPTLEGQMYKEEIIQSREQTAIDLLPTEVEGKLKVQGGLKEMPSLGALSNVSVTEKLSLVAEVQRSPSRKQQALPLNFAELLMSGNRSPSDLESNIDDTLSIATSTSAEHFIMEGTTTTEDEPFGADDVVEAEEAVESVQDIAVLRRKEKALSREVNVFDLLLEDLNVYAGSAGGQTTALGFASNICCGERLRKNCGQIYEERGATFESAWDGIDLGTGMDGKLKLEVRSAPRQSSIKVDVSEMNICLSDEVVSQLAPFIENPTEDEHPPALELSLQKCQIEIKDPKKKFPLRIRLGELNIEDGPSSTTSNRPKL